MLWKKRRKSADSETKAPDDRKESEHATSSERRGSITTSASYGGMGVRELQLRMELLVDQVLSSHRSVFEPAKQLAEFAKIEQDRFLNSVDKIRNTSVELAYNFCHFAPKSLQSINEERWNDWITRLLEIYDNAGVNGAIAAMKNVDEYIQSTALAPESVTLDDITQILESFVIGLHGRKLTIEASDSLYTDTEMIRLPEVCSTFKKREDNFSLYKTMAVHQWAQTRFGTWRMNIDALAKTYQDPDRALALFYKLETIRLDACIERELPGIARAMKNLSVVSKNQDLSKNWNRAIKKLKEAGATVRDTMFFLETVYKESDAPEDKVYQGNLHPRETWKIVQKRKEREKENLKDRLTEFQHELAASQTQLKITNKPSEENSGKGFSVEKAENGAMPDGYEIELRFDGKAVDPPEDIERLLESILQDFGEIPDQYLDAAEQHNHQDDDETEQKTNSVSTDKNKEIYFYDEWDHSRQKYRKEWCQLRELAVRPVHDDFVIKTLKKHRLLLSRLQRTFELLREDSKRTRRQPYGDDIDIDAVIEAFSDTQMGLEASQNLFTKSQKIERNIAVMFMIDMSGSTAGWINGMEREALVLLCESLEILGDRYAIYGFSGLTHERCDLYKVKEFDELYNDTVKARISGIQPQDYTRMGAAIRHLTKLLHQVEARTKLLITLSDGRPDDQDGYRGPYGIEDTRRALIEAKFLEIHPFCITIDQEAMDYLQHMYGAVNFAVVDQVDKLPYKVSDIYRRITV